MRKFLHLTIALMLLSVSYGCRPNDDGPALTTEKVIFTSRQDQDEVRTTRPLHIARMFESDGGYRAVLQEADYLDYREGDCVHASLEWLEVTVRSSRIVLEVSENESGMARYAVVIIGDGDQQVTMTVIQGS